MREVNSHQIDCRCHTENPADFFESIKCELEQVKQCIEDQLKGLDESVMTVSKDFKGTTGKLMRSGLLLLCGRCVSDLTEDHITTGSIVEMIHNATLLHDDVIDQGMSRRGETTINSIHGNRNAILLGDFILSKAFVISNSLKDRKIAEVLSTTAERICVGEITQNVKRQALDLTEQEYIQIITDKTASFFASSCHLGSLISGGNESTCRHFHDYGLNLGIAFQIADDLLDLLGHEEQTGKTAGGDMLQQKLTLPVIHFLEHAGSSDKNRIMTGLQTGNISDIVQLLKNSDSLEYARQQSNDYSQKAVACIKTISAEKTAHKSLIKIADFAAQRTF